METRVSKYGGQASPEDGSRTLAELPSPISQNGRKIPVVYYLCRNRHLEHPHFIEVPLSSPDGLYLRDFINRLNVLRGKGMASMYSWSCKKSYKNGFVWHDLSRDDLVLPANGNEYVLKGSKLLNQSPSDRAHQISGNPKFQSIRSSQHENCVIVRAREATTSSYSAGIVLKENKPSLYLPSPTEDEQSPYRSGFSSNISSELESSRSPSWDNDSYGTVEYRVYRPIGAADASTQTDDAGSRAASARRRTCTIGVSTDDIGRRAASAKQNTCTIGISTDDGGSQIELNETRHSPTPRLKEEPEIIKDEISVQPTSSSVATSNGKSETLESLIKADATSNLKSFRILEEENDEVFYNPGPRMRATNMLMHLISCGSISVKDRRRLGLMSTYNQNFSNAKFPSPIFSSSTMFGESGRPRLAGMKLEDKEYFSGSLIETTKHEDVGGETVPTLKRSSSYNADGSSERYMSSKLPDSRKDIENKVGTLRSKCLSRTLKNTSSKQAKSEPARSPLSDVSRVPSGVPDCSQASNNGSKRITEALTVTSSSMRVNSSDAEKEKVIKIEERLTSGARVIIQCRAPCDDTGETLDC